MINRGKKVLRGLLAICIIAVSICNFASTPASISAEETKEITNVDQEPIQVSVRKVGEEWIKVTNPDGTPVDPSNPTKIHIGDEVKFEIKWKIDDLDDVNPKDWFEFELPSDYITFTPVSEQDLIAKNEDTGVDEKIGTFEVIGAKDGSNAKIRIVLNDVASKKEYISNGHVTVHGKANAKKLPGDVIEVGSEIVIPIEIEPAPTPGFSDKEAIEKNGWQLGSSTLVTWGFSVNYDVFKPVYEGTEVNPPIKNNVVLIDELPEGVSFKDDTVFTIGSYIYAADDSGKMTTKLVTTPDGSAQVWDEIDLANSFTKIEPLPSQGWESFKSDVKSALTPSYGVFEDTGTNRTKIIFNFGNIYGSLSSKMSQTDINNAIDASNNLSETEKTNTKIAYARIFASPVGTKALAFTLFLNGVNVDNNVTQNISNKATLSWDSITKDAEVDFKYEKVTGGAMTGDPQSVTIKKIDAETGRALKDVSFRLLKQNIITGDYEPYTTKDVGGNPRMTDASGTVVFKKLENGKYLIEEVAPPAGYTADVEFNPAGGKFVITGGETTTIYVEAENTKIKTSVSGVKTWDDDNNRDGARPSSITVRLYANGTEIKHKVVTQTDGWAYSFGDLPMYDDNGVLIAYTLSEDPVSDYTTVQSGNNFTNSRIIEKTSISGTKTWDDDGNRDKVRPDSITVRLLEDGVEIASKVVKESDGWAYSFNNLSKYKAGKVGQLIVYTVVEDPVNNYTTTQSGNNFTNTHIIEKTSVSGLKTWNDDGDRDRVRPNSITVRLYADGTEIASKVVKESDGWAYSFNDLPKNKDGVEITYTLSEDPISDYTTTQSGNNFTNTHIIEKTSISGLKIWDDDGDRDKVRPDSITIRLYADGVEVASKVVKEVDGWIYNFTNLPKNKDGVEITYTLSEDPIANYTTTQSGNNFTNKHIIDKTSVSGVKTWVDDGDRDRLRPNSITVRLYADGTEVASKVVKESDGWAYSFNDLPLKNNGILIIYTLSEDPITDYTTTQSGNDFTNTHIIEKTSVSGVKTWNDDGDRDRLRPNSITVRLYADGTEIASKVVKESDGWAYSFNDLPKNKDGVEINYTLSEDPITDYTTTQSGNNFTNTHIIEKTSVSGLKTWNDDGDRDRLRPNSITVRLYADGTEIASKVVKESDGWAYSFNDLPKNKDGVEINYTLSEDPITDYTTTQSGNNFTNTHIIEKTSVSGLKTWNDDSDRDRLRPNSITVRLYADGTEIASKVVKESDGWAYSFNDLPKNKDGVEITYTLSEDPITDYTTTQSGNNFTNTHIIEKTSISGLKTWDDDGDRDKVRPDSITIRLYANGVEIASKVVKEVDGWTYSFNDLPKNKDGVEIIYTLREDPVDHYTTTQSGNNFTNKHIIDKTSISGTKTWDDDGDRDKLRPTSITIRLHADGNEIASKVVSETDGWAYSFNDLPLKNNGILIVYTVSEDAVSDYTTSQTGNNFTNKHIIEKTSVSGLKTWNDDGDRDRLRPDSITVRLYADGTEIASKVVKESDGWAYSFNDLPKNKDGVEITYTLSEDPIADYTTTQSGNNFTNTHIIEKTSISGLKTWDDDDNRDKVRPDSITVRLYADGTEIASKVVKESDGWAYSFNDLPKNKDGIEITYTLSEDPVDKYTTTQTGYNFRNSYIPQKTSISGIKSWDDDGDRDRLRPASITIRLLADGTEVDSRVVSEADGWAYSFTNLPKNKDGVEIVYTLSEDAVSDYTTTQTGNNFTNKHIIEKTSISGTKTWDDDGDRDRLRPTSITIRLLADGTEIDSKVVKESDGWAYSFTNLPKNKDGVEIVYTLSEDAVSDYTTTQSGNNFTNTHIIEKTSISGTKTWDDDGDRDRLRPASITIRLHADGTEIDSKVVSETDGWAYSFNDLPKNKDGVEIVYTLSEDAVSDYTTTQTGNNFTNKHIIEKTSISGIKTWVDDNDRDRVRPASITIRLYADGTEIDSKVVSEADGWAYSFNNLPKNKDGVAIVYTVSEDAVNKYTTTQSGNDFTNTHIIEKTDISVLKVWNDNNNKDNLRPTAINVQLYANDLPYGLPVQLSEENTWKHTWSELPKNKDGIAITYTVKELNVPIGYTSSITINAYGTHVITNTHDDPEEPPKDVTFKPSESPSTSDTSNIYLFYGLLFASFSLLARKSLKRRED